MATNENIAMIKQVYDCFNRRDWEGLVRLCRKEVEWNDVPARAKFSGPEGVTEFMKNWAGAFPDGKVEVTRVLASNDFGLAECRFSGTNQGELRGPMGNLPASGRRGEMSFCEVFEFKNGKVLRTHTYPDYMSMMSDLGAISGRAAESWAGAPASL
jgi:steroid delta-isomerase-like uncharacterized protein